MKPLIGITVNYQNDDHVALSSGLGTPGQDFNYVAGDYVSSVERAGGIPVLIPQYYEEGSLEALLSKLDGIIVSGGHDVDPSLYHEENRYTGSISVERDIQDLHVIHYALEHHIPLLGICRGIQILNVALGGTLYQDNEKDAGFNNHFGLSHPRNEVWHKVFFSKDSILEKLYGSELMVNSYHHQSVRVPGNNVTVTAKAEDGVVEAIEVLSDSFVLAVQWHPEMLYDNSDALKLFQLFVGECIHE